MSYKGDAVNLPSASQELLLKTVDLGKCYRLYPRPTDRFKELVLRRCLHEKFWALSGIDICLERGSSLGLIGENGAGKSTLAKLIAGVLSPTSGHVCVRGRVASIIELGMGFHPEFTGRENVCISGSLLGFTRRQMEAKLSGIEAFAELGPFFNRPLKSYSTGMSMRLAFSLAVDVEPDLLVVDEALAVGDGHFRKKCMDRIRSFVDRGGSLLFCSHSLYAVSLLCQEAVWLKQGQIEARGPSATVISAYELYLGSKRLPSTVETVNTPDNRGKLGEVRILCSDSNGERVEISQGISLQVLISWSSDQSSREFHLGVAIERLDSLTCFAGSTHEDGLDVFSGHTRYGLILRFPAVQLATGSFRVVAYLLDERGAYLYDKKAADKILSVASEKKKWGLFYLEHYWEPEPQKEISLGPCLKPSSER